VRARYHGLLTATYLWHLYKPKQDKRLDDCGLTVLTRNRHKARAMHKLLIGINRKHSLKHVHLPRHQVNLQHLFCHVPHKSS
jgi:hypothetical protein